MKTRFDDRIRNFSLPISAPETPGTALSRRALLGILTAGAFVAFPRAARAGACSAGAFAHEVLITSLSFFPDGNTLISAGRDSFVKFWTIPAGALFRTIATDAIPTQVAVSPSGNLIAVAMQSGHLELWPADGSTRHSLVGHTDTVNGVAFTPDGGQLVSVSADRTTKIWSAEDGKLVRSFSDTGVMTQVAVPRAQVTGRGRAPQRRLVTAGTQIYVRSLSTGAIQQTVPGQTFALSADGTLLAAHDAAKAYMYTFPRLGLLVSVAEEQSANSMSFSADKTRLAIAYSGLSPRLDTAPDLTLAAQLQWNGDPSLSTAMDPQNRFLALSAGRNIYLYGLSNGAPVAVCFMDIAASAPSSNGLQYITSGTLYTLACGESIPFGYACSCNCVPGECPCVYDTGCGCDSDTGCSCDSNAPCSCDSNTGCSCVGNVGCSCDSDYGCGCVDDFGCGCDGDIGCGCDGDIGGGCGCDGDLGA
jgi:hypothetical protein